MPGLASPVTDERDALRQFVAYHQSAYFAVAYGLTDEQARATPTASALSIGALNVLRHDESLSGALEAFATQNAETLRLLESADLDAAVPVPRDAPWFPADVDAWTVRWVFHHVINELARHAGHADIIRESIDGATMYELIAGFEGWEPTAWLAPWRPGATA